MQLGSAFICDCRVKIFGFIPTPWVCGGIMTPVTPERTKLRCNDCGHEKAFPSHLSQVKRLCRGLGFAVAVAIIAMIFAPTAYSAPQQPLASCHQFVPYGTPLTSKGELLAVDSTHAYVCRHAYLVYNDEAAKLPEWVSYTLTPEHAIGCAARSNAFAADDTLSEGNRAKPADYVGSGFDMGHIAPDGDMRWDLGVERESFMLSNMTPQLPGLNRGLWKLLETAVRADAYENGHTLLIYAGPIYDVTTDKKIGSDQVDVPTGFYKIVVDTVTGQYTAFLFPQAGDLGTDLESVHVLLPVVEAKSGLTFPLPVFATESPIWQYNFKKLTVDIKAKCHK
jgi:endonuclease G